MAMQKDSVLIRNAQLAVAIEIQAKRAMNQPIAKCDPNTGEAYLFHADGRREVIGKISRGRYSERIKKKQEA